MENRTRMDESTKRNIGILSFLPLITFVIFTGYFLYIASPLIEAQQFQDHTMLASLMSQHYSTLFILLAIACTTGAVMLVYFVIHLARVRTIHAGNKIAWLIFMVTLGAIAFPVFWFLEIRNEPTEVPVWPSIA